MEESSNQSDIEEKQSNASDDYLMELFKSCDTDSSGYLSITELRCLCSKFGISHSDADQIFHDLDMDNDGQISFEDFRLGFDDYEKQILTSSTGIQKHDDESTAKLGKQINKKILCESGNQCDEFSSENRRFSYFVGTPPSASVINELVESVKRLQDENQRLINSWMKDKKLHQNHLNELEHEVDSQVKQAELILNQKAQEQIKHEKTLLREMMSEEMKELQSQFGKIDLLLKKIPNQMNSDEIKQINHIKLKLDESIEENRNLKMSLLDTQTNIALMRSELAQMRVQYEEKCKELVTEKEKAIEAHHDQDHLSRQLHLLQDANKRLQDTNDTLRDVIDVTAKSLSPNPMKKNSNNYKRGSVIGDYIKDVPLKHSSRLSEVDLESISTIDEEACSKHSFASCPPIINRNLDEQFDSGFSMKTREDNHEFNPYYDTEDYFSLPSTLKRKSLRSLQSSPSLSRQNVFLNKSKSSASNLNYLINESEMMSQIFSEAGTSWSDDRQSLDTIEMAAKEFQNGKHFNQNRHEYVVPVISEADGPPERTYKVIFIGDASVGKSTFIIRLAKGYFQNRMSATLGIDFHIKTFKINNKNIALQLWDTAGQERFRSITKSYFRKADAIVIMYDVTNESSFLNVREWINAVDEYKSKGVPVALIGNKIDLRNVLLAQDHACVKTEDGYALGQQFGIDFHEISCKDGDNVFDSIVQLTNSMIQNENRLIESSLCCGRLSLTEKNNKRLFSCCSK